MLSRANYKIGAFARSPNQSTGAHMRFLLWFRVCASKKNMQTIIVLTLLAIMLAIVAKTIHELFTDEVDDDWN